MTDSISVVVVSYNTRDAVRDCLHRSGEWLDGVGYALLADDWAGR